MICTCGHENPDGTTFCNECGSFLDFVADSSPSQTAAEPTPPAPADPVPVVQPPAGPSAAPPLAAPSPAPPPSPPAPPTAPPTAPPNDEAFDLPAPDLGESFDLPAPPSAEPPPPPPAPEPPPPPIVSAPPRVAKSTIPPPSAPKPSFDPSALVDDSTIIRDEPTAPPDPPSITRPSSGSTGTPPGISVGSSSVLSGADRPPPTSSAPSTGEFRPDDKLIKTEKRRVDREQAKVKEELVAKVKRGELQPGDLVCPQCGTGNDPSRSFCKKDAFDLREAPVAPQVSWWRKFWPFNREQKQAEMRRAKNPVSHGDSARKARMGYRKVLSMIGKVRRIGSFAAVLGLGAIFVIPSFRGNLTGFANDGIGWVKELTGLEESEQLKPAQIESADSIALVSDTCGEGLDTLAGSPPSEALVDENAFTFWRSAGQNPLITVTFKGPIDLTDIGVFNGSGTCDTHDYTDARRPQRIKLNYLRTDEEPAVLVGSETLTLKDVKTFESYEVDGNDFDTLQIEVIESFPALGNADIGEVRIAELEFYGQNE